MTLTKSAAAGARFTAGLRRHGLAEGVTESEPVARVVALVRPSFVSMRAILKRVARELLGKRGTVVVAAFVSGSGVSSRRMLEEIRRHAPGYPLVVIAKAGVDQREFPADTEWVEAAGSFPYGAVRRALGRHWVGLAPVMLEGGDRWERLLWAALTSPRRVIAFHPDGESHPLRMKWPVASWRFLRGQRLGDIFRPTAFWRLRDLGHWLRALALFGSWRIGWLRARKLSVSTDQQSDEYFAVIHLDKNSLIHELDDRIRTERALEIIVATGTEPPSDSAADRLLHHLRLPGVWMVTGRALWCYKFDERAVRTQDHESGTYCLGSDSNLLAIRRDIYLELGGMAASGLESSTAGLQALCLRALLRGWKTLYAGEVFAGPLEKKTVEGTARVEVDTAELLVAAVDAPAIALQALHRYGGDAGFRRRYWRAVRSVRPVVAAGKSGGELFPLALPGATAYTGRGAGQNAGRRPQVGVLTPYFPYPLSHGGAIRIYNLLRHAAAEFDIHLFAFSENESTADLDAIREYCARVVLAKPPVWELPRWIRLLPRGVPRYRVEQMRQYVQAFVKDFGLGLLQIEFSQLAFFGKWLASRVPKVLVEHDVTFDLHRQAFGATQGWRRVQARAEAWRWRKFELAAMPYFDRVITMSGGDRRLLAANGVPEAKLAVVENGIDLERFQACAEEATEERLLFIGSFRHFPNVRAYRLLAEEVWPRIRSQRPAAKLTVVAGPDPALFWSKHLAGAMPAPPPGIELREFVADVRPLYEVARVVAVPVPLSAGTNIKVLEALAMGRPVVSTTVGCAGLDLEHGRDVLLADDPETFAQAVLRLFADAGLRRGMSSAGRRHVEQRFGWEALAAKQMRVWEELFRGGSTG